MKFNIDSFIRSLPSLDLTKNISESEHSERIKRTQEYLEKNNLDAGFVYSSELKPGDTGWLTGYEPSIEDTGCIVGERKALIVGGPEGELYANEQKKAGEFRNVKELQIPEEDYPGAKFYSFDEVFKEACGKTVKRIGLLSPKSVVPVEILDIIKESTGAEIVDASDFLFKARYIKSNTEQELMKTAAVISTYAMQAMVDALEVGIRENEVAACGDFIMRYMGSDGRPGYSTFVNSGYRSSNVIGRASNKIIEDGELVVLGASARFQGMTSCLGRTVVAGKGNDAQYEFLEHGTKAYEYAVKEFGYEKPAKNVDIAARKYLSTYKLDPMYSVVHNIGWTEAMEGCGAATQYSTYNFQKNITVMVDVGIFYRPFKSIEAQNLGFRMEDPFLINDAGKVEKMTDMAPRAWK